MTENPLTPGGGDAAQKPPSRTTARRPLPSPLAVITAALGLFFVILTLLAIQVRNGRDPALGPGPAVGAVSQPASKGGQVKQATKIVSRSSPVAP